MNYVHHTLTDKFCGGVLPFCNCFSSFTLNIGQKSHRDTDISVRILWEFSTLTWFICKICTNFIPVLGYGVCVCGNTWERSGQYHTLPDTLFEFGMIFIPLSDSSASSVQHYTLPGIFCEPYMISIPFPDSSVRFVANIIPFRMFTPEPYRTLFWKIWSSTMMMMYKSEFTLPIGLARECARRASWKPSNSPCLAPSYNRWSKVNPSI